MRVGYGLISCHAPHPLSRTQAFLRRTGNDTKGFAPSSGRHRDHGLRPNGPAAVLGPREFVLLAGITTAGPPVVYGNNRYRTRRNRSGASGDNIIRRQEGSRSRGSSPGSGTRQVCRSSDNSTAKSTSCASGLMASRNRRSPANTAPWPVCNGSRPSAYASRQD